MVAEAGAHCHQPMAVALNTGTEAGRNSVPIAIYAEGYAMQLNLVVFFRGDSDKLCFNVGIEEI